MDQTVKFTPLDMQTWPRGQMFYYFSKMASTGYSLTVDLDVTAMRTALKHAGIKFFPAYLWLVTRTLQMQKEFKIAELDGQVGCFDTLTPLYAAFHEDDKTFSFMWTEYTDDFMAFYQSYLDNQRRYGGSHVFSKLALEKAAPTVLLAVRFTVAVAAMTLVILVNALVGKLRGRPLFIFSLRGKPVYQLLLLGIVQPVAYFIFENYGILYTSSAVAGTIIAAVPVCCILMDVLVLHEKVTLKQVLCAVCAIGGVALISAGGAVMVSALGMLFLLLTMLSDTLYYGISHSAAKLFTPFEMTYVMFAVGMVVFIPVALLHAGGLTSPMILEPLQDGQFWLAVLYLGLLSSVMAYGLLNFANSHLSVSETSLFSNVTTVVSVLAGVVLLKESFSVWQMLGVVIILVCVFVANVSGKETKSHSQEV